MRLHHHPVIPVRHAHEVVHPASLSKIEVELASRFAQGVQGHLGELLHVRGLVLVLRDRIYGRDDGISLPLRKSLAICGSLAHYPSIDDEERTWTLGADLQTPPHLRPDRQTSHASLHNARKNSAFVESLVRGEETRSRAEAADQRSVHEEHHQKKVDGSSVLDKESGPNPASCISVKHCVEVHACRRVACCRTSCAEGARIATKLCTYAHKSNIGFFIHT